jgi:hypothetical protein
LTLCRHQLGRGTLKKRSRSFHWSSLDRTGAYWLDTASDLSCKGSTRQHAVDDPLLSCKSLFPTFGRFLLLGMVMGTIGGHDHHRRHPRARAALAGDPAPGCPHHHAATAAGPVSTTALPWSASSISCAPAFPGGCCPPVSLAAVARLPAGGGCATGSAPASGSSCTTNCWTSSAGRASSTGRGPVWIRSACAPKGGRPDRPESDRPRQDRVQIPPAGRPQRHPLGRRAVGGQHPRLGAAGTHCGCRAGDQGTWWAAWPAPQAARQAALRQGCAPRGVV